MDNNVKVSIICNAYNQEKYIRRALEGFLRQKTTFPFEVLVHDDASSDTTPQIIREYEQKYPGIIKPIYETENQHSKHDGSLKRIQYGRILGKYAAFCEGDDEWISCDKLQKQYDYMEKNSGCTFCFTNAFLAVPGKKMKTYMVPQKHTGQMFLNGDNHLSFEDVAAIPLIPTASFFIPSEVLLQMPAAPKEVFGGDLYIRLYAASRGYSHFMNEVTCIYNFRVPNSVTTRWNQSQNSWKKHLIRKVNLFEYLNEITNREHEPVLTKLSAESQYEAAFASGDRKTVRCRQYYDIAKSKGLREWLRYICFVFLPGVYRFVYFLKHGKDFQYESCQGSGPF